MILTTVEESRELDRTAMEEFGIPEEVLMENAGSSFVRLLSEEIAWEGSRCCVICGTGNNGGDGFVIARYAKDAGAEVTVLLMGSESHMSQASLMYKKVAEKMEIPVVKISKADDATPYISSADILVDALIGTGLSKEVTGEKAALITLMNDSDAVIASVDVPSGLFCDTGRAAGSVVNADYTVALGSVKRGHVLYPGCEYAGKVLYSPIGIPDCARANYPVCLLEADDVRAMLPVRSKISHKGNNGFIGIFAGSEGMAGAGLLSAQGALYAGGGKIALVTVGNAAFQLMGKIPEVMVSSCGEAPFFREGMTEKALEKAKDYDVIALGPGFGRDYDTQIFTAFMLQSYDKTAVVDADALFAISELKLNLKECPGQLILTPHIGEFARLTGLPAKEAEEHRVDAAKDFAVKNHCVLVLKGAPTVVASPDGRVWVNSTGNPGMATGGMGDTLTGIIAALAGQGCPSEEAAAAGVYLHGLAGDILAEETPVGYTAGMVAQAVPRAREAVLEVK